MLSFAKFGTGVAAGLLLLGGCSGENKPTDSQLREALIVELPEYVTVTDFTVEAMENTGNEVEPSYISRYKAKGEVISELYTRDGSVGDVLFLLSATEAGTELELFGKSRSELYQGGWAHDLYVEGNPIRKLGRPLTEFAPARTIVRGSAEETAYQDELNAKHAAFNATLAELPLDDMIIEFYGAKSEFAGQYVIGEVLKSRAEKSNDEQFIVHANYAFKKAGASKPGGSDSRTFTFSNTDGTWQVVSMGFARSGKI